MWAKAGIIACMLLLFYQDLRYRAVSWIVFPVLLCLFLADAWLSDRFYNFAWDIACNIAFLLVQLVLLTLYFSLKMRRLVNIAKEHLGWGDMLFMCTIAFYMSPFNYLLFYIVTLIVALLVAIMILSKWKTAEPKIPLAGIQAILFAAFMLCGQGTGYFTFRSDNWLISYLTR